MPNFQTLAKQMADAFESRLRDNKESFRCLKEGSPEWMTDVCREAHGDMLPDDWRYRFIDAAVSHFAETDDCDDYHEGVDSAVSVYTNELTAWLGSHAHRPEYCDEAAREFGMAATTGMIERIQAGQFAEIDEVFGLVSAALQHEVSDDDDGAAA